MWAPLGLLGWRASKGRGTSTCVVMVEARALPSRPHAPPARTTHGGTRYRRVGRHSGIDAGVTLLETLIVLAIIMLLLGIAVPTYSAFRDRAQVRAAQATLYNAILGAEKLHDALSGYEAVTLELLNATVPGITFVHHIATDNDEVSVFSPNDDVIILATRADTGLCLLVQDQANTGVVFFGEGTCNASRTKGVDFTTTWEGPAIPPRESESPSTSAPTPYTG